MSIINSILKVLNMEDQNLVFDENCIEEKQIHERRCLVFKASLDVPPQYCPRCGSVQNIKKNGIVTLKPIKIPKVSELTAYLILKKQLYKCNHCNHKITPQTSEVQYRCRISNNTKQSVINYCKKIVSHTYIAEAHNISNMTVQRIVDRVYDGKKLYRHDLPENICIDEFTALKREMAFHFCDAVTGKTIDLVLGRKVEQLQKYFSYYLLEARNRVKTVVMDMYKPYLGFVKKSFPNALIVIDRFHIVQLLSRSLNKTRVQAMKQDKENYRKLKRYWRLLLKPRGELDCSKWKKYLCFKPLMTEVDIVDYLLKTNSVLCKTYECYQSILYALQRNDYTLFETIITQKLDGISNYMETTCNTLNEFKDYIKNTLELPFSNGVMERNNNTCKYIKRVAFGFRNFDNLRARALLHLSVLRCTKKVPVSTLAPFNV